MYSVAKNRGRNVNSFSLKQIGEQQAVIGHFKVVTHFCVYDSLPRHFDRVALLGIYSP